MKILVLGADGMLGHQLVQSFQARHEVHATLRLGMGAYSHIRKFLPESAHYGIDARNYPAVHHIIKTVRPDAVVNALGIVKQRIEANDAILCLETNALLPHRLRATCAEVGARLVQLSTDCVFSGHQGNYSEADVPDANDLYGRSKLLGELEDPGCLTLRTSIIGLELSRKHGLIEWFLAQTGSIKGYRKAIYSGFTTLDMARIIEQALENQTHTSGVWHVSSAPIDKYTLLTRIRDRLRRPIEIVPDDDLMCDRSLDSSQFQAAFAYTPPTWDSMIEELCAQIEERYPSVDKSNGLLFPVATAPTRDVRKTAGQLNK